MHPSLRCLMVIRSSVCGPMSPCYVHTKLHPEHTSHQGDSCGCHRLYITPCGMDNMLQTPPAHQEQQPYLFSLDFSSSPILESIYQDQGARKATGGDRKQTATRCPGSYRVLSQTWKFAAHLSRAGMYICSSGGTKPKC